MADAVPVGQQDPQGPQGGKVSKRIAALDPNSPPLQAARNPLAPIPNAGTPDQPVYEMSKGVRDILDDVSRSRPREPLAEVEITPPQPDEPGRKGAQPFIRTDW